MPKNQTNWWLVAVAIVTFSGCPDNGHRLNVCDNPQLSCDDGNACTADSCDPDDGCLNEPIVCSDRNACTNDRCDPSLGCVYAAVPCDDGNACTSNDCDPSRGCLYTDTSARCGDANVCTADSCSPSIGCVNAAIDCDDDNECTAESCDPVSGCRSSAIPEGTPCDRGLGQCIAGGCEPLGCTNDQGCNDQDACTRDRCDLATHLCVNTDISATCDDGNACTEDGCVAASGCTHTDISDRCDDGDDCSLDSCVPTTGCAAEPADDGTVCAGGDGVCRDGACQSLVEVEYQQTFETLDRASPTALANDGWLVYGNVFNEVDESFLYGYGPYPAPNDGAAFCAIVADQGGATQGSQQLSVYSDYNNGDQANGRLIESNVYQERTIGAADLGRTITFSFDAKRGNINDPASPLCPCSSKAIAFLKTLNPAAGFATTNLVRKDTTDLPEGWARYEVSLAIDSGLDGQLLQFGFATTATLYQPSGNFYDNILVKSRPTASGSSLPSASGR